MNHSIGTSYSEHKRTKWVPSSIFAKSGSGLIHALHVMLTNIRRLQKIKISTNWKCAAITPIHIKAEKYFVKNYRPIIQLNNDSKIHEKCPCKSTLTNVLSFLQKDHKALDDDSRTEIIAFKQHVSNVFDKVPHFEVLCRVAAIGGGGCILEAIFDHLTNRKQFVRVESVCSQMKDFSSGVPQGSWLFCVLINDLTESVIFIEIYLFADDLKNLSVNRCSSNSETPAFFRKLG